MHIYNVRNVGVQVATGPTFKKNESRHQYFHMHVKKLFLRLTCSTDTRTTVRELGLLQGAVTTKVFVFAACTGTIWQRCSGGGCSLAQLGDKNIICLEGLDSTGLAVAIDFPV